MTDLETYQHLLRTHDWNYSRSDDPKQFRAGASERARLGNLRDLLDPTGEIWNSIAPAEYAVHRPGSRPRGSASNPVSELNRALAAQAGKVSRLYLASQRAIQALEADDPAEAKRLLKNALELETTLENLKKDQQS